LPLAMMSYRLHQRKKQYNTWHPQAFSASSRKN